MDDFRPESHSPKHYDFRDIIIHKPRVGTERNWLSRKEYCLKNVYTNLAKLIQDSKSPTNTSLATFKPAAITGFEWKEDKREWKDVWVEIRKQTDMFAQENVDPQKMIPKVPYKFYYKLLDDTGKPSKMMIEDWEIGELYWKCLKREKDKGVSNMKEAEIAALEKVKEKYYHTFTKKNEIYLFLGTTKTGHAKRYKNPFVIIGVFYPMKEVQGTLF